MELTRSRVRFFAFKVLLLIFALIILAASAYAYAYRDRLFPLKSTVLVYGREACGITSMVRADLAKRGLRYTFADVDVRAIDDELWYKLGPRFNEPRITFPIVHVAGKMLLTPTAEEVARELNAYVSSTGLGDPERDYATLLEGADPAPHY